MPKEKRLSSTYFFETLTNSVKEEIERNKDVAALSLEIKSPCIRVSYRCSRDVIFKVRRQVLSVARKRDWETVDRIFWEHYHFRDVKQLDKLVSGYVWGVAQYEVVNDSIHTYHALKKNGFCSGRKLTIGNWYSMEEEDVARVLKQKIPVSA